MRQGWGLSLVAGVLVGACTEPVLDYCDKDNPACPAGMWCDVDAKTCRPSDAGLLLDGLPLNQDTSPDLMLDGKQPGCGDGELNGNEQCDGIKLGGKSCVDLGFTGGALSCNSDCTFDTSTCTKCGDDSLNPGEQCDGQDLGNQTCEGLGFDGGTLSCKSDCSFDTAACHKCGDGAKNGPDQCDGTDLDGKSCNDMGFYSGALGCKNDCTFDTAGCTNCGNTKLDPNEQCDGSVLAGKTCQSLGFDTGTLACQANCAFDTSGCQFFSCGDNQVTGGEQCDGSNLDGKTCVALGYAGGSLSCNGNCTFNPVACFKCGDGTINTGEVCDGANLASQTCVTKGFDGGIMSCASDCKSFVTTACYRCGDNKKNGGEQCDGTDLGGATCGSVGFYSGSLACTSSCTFNTAGCTNCGNNAIDAGEQCDGTSLGGKSCATAGFYTGTLKCSGSCTLDTSSCTNCGNNTIDTGEVCDGTALGGQTCQAKGYDGGALVCSKTCSALLTNFCCELKPRTWVKIPAGTFMMGTPPSNKCKQGNEDYHQVTFTYEFEIFNSEVTQEEFSSRMGYNPSNFTSCTPNCPVEKVNWHQAADFCNKLSTDAGLSTCYGCTKSGTTGVTCSANSPNIHLCTGYRLPTDAEWEYVYRAGTTTDFYSGPHTAATCMDPDPNATKIGWYDYNSSNATHPGATKESNNWCIFDMAGNVYEWVNDWYQDNLGTSAVTNPVGPGSSTGDARTRRGGSWAQSAGTLRAGARESYQQDLVNSQVGFRCARTL